MLFLKKKFKKSKKNQLYQSYPLSTTLQYESCVNQIKSLKCNNIDQWQSVIQELKLEIENSQEIEIPFLIEQKQQIIDEYRNNLIQMRYLEYENNWQKQMLETFQQGVQNSTDQIKSMYKLPEQISQETEFLQKLANKQQIQTAEESIEKAKEEYDIADISIQAQTTSNVMRGLEQKIPGLSEIIQEQYNSQIKLLSEKKVRLKEQIFHLRSLLQNEKMIQEKNKVKIEEMKAKIQNCQNKPTNIEKDCGPILVIAEKLYTEIDTINSRTNVLIKEFSIILQKNGQQDLSKYQEKIQKEKEGSAEEDFANQEEAQQLPIEQEPKEHFIKMEEEKKTQQNVIQQVKRSADQSVINENSANIFSYKQNTDENIVFQLENGDEEYLDKILEKTFFNEDNSNDWNNDDQIS